MDGYEKILKVVRSQNKINTGMIMGKMLESNKCKVGSIELDDDDLLFNEQLVGKLKKGDTVLIYRLSDEKYVIIAKVVSA